MLVTVFIISMTSLLVSIAFFVRQPQPGEVTVSDIQELRTTVERLDDQLMQMGNGVLVQELNKSVSGLKAALELSSAIQEQHYQQLNATIFTVVESVRTVSPTNELDLTTGCGIPITATCVINHNDVNTPPTSETCETSEEPLDVPGFRIVNIYCSVDNSAGETNPVTSTLNIFHGEASCLCSLVALTAPIASPNCKLTIQRCPDTIRLNTTNMQ